MKTLRFSTIGCSVNPNDKSKSWERASVDREYGNRYIVKQYDDFSQETIVLNHNASIKQVIKVKDYRKQ